MTIDRFSFLETEADTGTSSAAASEKVARSTRNYLLRSPNNTADNLRDAWKLMLGYTSATASLDGRLNRTPPYGDPVFRYLYASALGQIKGIGNPTQQVSDLVQGVDGPLLMPYYTSYDTWEIPVEFTTRPYPVLDNDAITTGSIDWTAHQTTRDGITPLGSAAVTSKYATEWQRYLDWDLTVQNESISAVAGVSLFKTGTQAAPNNAQFQGMPRIFLPNQVVRMIWYQVPLRYWTSQNSYIRRWPGYINNQNFFPWGTIPYLYPAGSLLYLGATPKIYTSTTVQQIDGNQGNNPAWKFMDVELAFLVTYRISTDIPATGNANFLAAGHNLQAYFPNRQFYYVIFNNGVAQSGTVTNGVNTMTVTSNVGLPVGATIAGPSVPNGTTITAVNVDGVTITMSANATGNQTNAVYAFSGLLNTPYWFSFPFELLFTDPDTPQDIPYPLPG